MKKNPMNTLQTPTIPIKKTKNRIKKKTSKEIMKMNINSEFSEFTSILNGALKLRQLKGSAWYFIVVG